MSPDTTNIRTYPPVDSGSTQSGKFLQINCEGVAWLLFTTPETHRFHNQLLAQFLEEEHIPHHWFNEETLEFPVERVQVTGGGRYSLNLEAGSLDLWDNSQAYGRFDAGLAADQLADSPAPWCNLNLVMR